MAPPEIQDQATRAEYSQGYSTPATAFQERYYDLVQAYIERPSEEILASIADLSRELLRDEVPPEELAELHENAISRLARATPSLRLCDVSSLISAPLMEMLMAYGLLLREHNEDRKRNLERLSYLAQFDQLTGLANRALFRDRLSQAMHRADRQDQPLALMFIDLDGFKAVNDSLGHANGDLLLKKVAERLTSCLRATDTVSRLGGDEFTLIFEAIPSPEYAATIAQRLLEVIFPPFSIAGQEVRITASIGITIYPADDRDLNLLLKNADIAMYRAKELGRNTFQFYEPTMSIQANERHALRGALGRALDRQEFVLYYQPIIELASGRVCGLEALLRWNHPEYGVMAPGEFLPIAEESGLIVPIGEWTIHTACSDTRAWQEAVKAPVAVSVNLSAHQFRQPNLFELVTRIINETGLKHRYLTFELNESKLMENFSLVVSTLLTLKSLGLSIAIDDFGTGYSSLSYLKRFPFDSLKIDQSFIREITNDPDDASIVAAMIAMAHNLRLEVTAEAVETREQLDFLLDHGCDRAQGFFLCPPLPPESVGPWLQRHVQGIDFTTLG